MVGMAGAKNVPALEKAFGQAKEKVKCFVLVVVIVVIIFSINL
jgi:hypothetical protein